jgi:hypothetical protein
MGRDTCGTGLGARGACGPNGLGGVVDAGLDAAGGTGALGNGRGGIGPGAAGRAAEPIGRGPKSVNIRRSGMPGTEPGRDEPPGTGRPGPKGRGLLVKSIYPPLSTTVSIKRKHYKYNWFSYRRLPKNGIQPVDGEENIQKRVIVTNITIGRQKSLADAYGWRL